MSVPSDTMPPVFQRWLLPMLWLGACAPTSAEGDTSPPGANAPEPPAASASADAPGPHAADGIARPAPRVDRVACSLYWRKSDSHGFQPEDERQVVFDAVGHERVVLHDYDLDVRYTGSSAGGRALEILARTGRGTISERYDFGSDVAAAHLPSGGHGFTGLRYLTHPASGSELQYFCGGYDASTDFSDDAFSQSTPGPAAPASSTISCALTLRDAAGTVLSDEVLVVDSAQPRSASVGEFSFEARRIAGEHESGGILIDASMPGFPRLLHSLYQTHGGDVPMNLVQGPSFTGQRQLTEPGGSTLTYACRTDQS